ncbi:MAG: SDR family NAD(P)-dependent oxidoreductase [Gammaproteobacteria bacterium]
MSRFGSATTTDEVLEGVDLTGRLALVTGGTSGLGQETARALAGAGAKVVLTARELSKGEAAASEIRASTGNQAVEAEELELGSLDNIQAFSQRVLARHSAIDLVINNAGIMACAEGQTADGFEMQFGTNHLGHFLMTCLLMPAVLNAPAPRIVSLSSRGHQMSPVVFEDLFFADREYDKWLAYGQSKTANILFAVELQKRLGQKGVNAYSVHPGVIMTKLGRHMSAEDIEALRARIAGRQVSPGFKSIPAGAATSVYAATAPELQMRGGSYLEDCGVAAIDDVDTEGGVRSYAVDSATAAKLWQVSEKLVGQEFPLD